jgi:hypothetical protein
MPAGAVDVQKLVGAMGVVAWYGLTYLVVKRIFREYLK